MNIKFRRNLKLIEDEFGKSQTSLAITFDFNIKLQYYNNKSFLSGF